jgi:GxxExxY protein
MLEDEGYKVMGAAFEVYNELGYGMAEEIYQQSLEIELTLRSIPFQTKCDLNVFYKGHSLGTFYRPDLLVWDQIVVELKAITELISDHEAQLFNYMRIARKEVGYLINFGKKGHLEWKRFVISDLHSNQGKPSAPATALSLH